MMAGLSLCEIRSVMTESVSETAGVPPLADAASALPQAAASEVPTGAVTAQEPAGEAGTPTEPPTETPTERGARRGRRGGRGRSRPEGGEGASAQPAAAQGARDRGRDGARQAGREGGREGGRRPPRQPGAERAERSAAAPQSPKPARPARSHPVLDQLAALYPALFGEQPLPLKRGIFQDLQDAHPEVFEREALKAALALHTRSSRYLTAVAAGQQRHDLQGQPVEAMAPEHVHHALLEVFRRRQQRPGAEDLRPKLRRRIVQAFEASGLSSEAYAARVIGRDEAANAVLDEALAEAAEAAARDEARLRAFEASGQTVQAFADMYGFDPRDAARTVERAQRRRQLAADAVAAAAAASAAAEVAPPEAADDAPEASELPEAPAA